MSENNVPPLAVSPSPPVAEPQKRGFAVTALVLGIVAIMGSWIPFVSIGSALIGVVGLVFGIIAVVKAAKGTAGGKVMAIVGTTLSVLAVVFAMLSTSAGAKALDETLDEVNADLATVANTTPDSDEQSVKDEGSAGEPAQPEESSDGTRDNPFPVGSVLSNEEVEVILGDANWAADEIVAAENQFNEPAPEGSTYVLLPVTITNVASSEPVTPWLELQVFYVAPDGRSFDEASAVVPNDLMDIDDLYEGGTGSGNLVYTIPSDAQEGGVWGVEVGWFSDTVFVEAK